MINYLVIIFCAFLLTICPVISDSAPTKSLLFLARQVSLKYPTTSPFIVIIDFKQPSTEKRLYVLDLRTSEVIFTTFVAHGSGSGGIFPTKFSNRVNSHESSLGVFITTSFYQGRHGLSLRVRGLEKGINDNAEKRLIVIHGAWYANRAGRSQGCFAVPINDVGYLIHLIGSGTLIYAYYK